MLTMRRLRHPALLAVLLLAGCDTYAASRYAINADTVVALREFAGQRIAVGPFTAATPGESQLVCRAVGPLKTPDGETFENYIRKALVDEMRIAGVYAEGAPLVLTGRLNEVAIGSVSGTWTLSLTVASNDGGSFTEVETYKFTSSFAAVTACREAANALMPAVQNLIVRVVRNPAFRQLLGVPATS